MIDPSSWLFITLDSCRWDTFAEANAPNLKAVGELNRAMAPAQFTYASHQAMFVGFTPGVAGADKPYLNPRRGKFFRMSGGGAPRRHDFVTLEGANIIQGFKRLGYLALGTAAVRWFNPRSQTGRKLTCDFHRYHYTGNYHSVRQQVDWVMHQLHRSRKQRFFVFMNIGETHLPYYHEGAGWSPDENPCVEMNPDNTNDSSHCRERQRACLEFVDTHLGVVIDQFRHCNILICGDHGDCWGEDGLWSHGFHHPKVLEVPLVFRLAKSATPSGSATPPLWRQFGRRIKRLLEARA